MKTRTNRFIRRGTAVLALAAAIAAAPGFAAPERAFRVATVRDW